MTIGKPNILCVDDEPSNLRLLEAMLTARGYEVIKAVNGREAMEKISQNKIDLVLLDVMMPEINGFDVCKMIKKEEIYRNIPVILVTALGSSKDRVRGIESGADDFISKPFDHGEILARINMLLKVKSLNERLNSAYLNINSMVSYGEEIVKHFDPLHFNLMPMLDNIVSMCIRKTEDMVEKPETIIIGLPDKTKQWQWFKYQCLGGEITKHEIENHFSSKLTAFTSQYQRQTKIEFSNKADIGKSECCPFIADIAKFEPNSIAVSNMVCYCSDKLVILALNYGRDVTAYDASVLNSLVMQSMFLMSLSKQVRETEDAFDYIVYALARAAEANDEDTGNHIIRVGAYCSIIAKQLGLSENFINLVRLQAQMHDVGKIHIHPDILRKPGKLTPEEFDQMKQHTIYGAKILGDHVRLMLAKEIALSHHERWDGSGYPYGLKGEQIPLSGRILNIADQYDALRNARVYKPAFDHQKTYHIITEGDGRTMPHHFDPRILQAFKETSHYFEEIYETHREV
ncbi:MAG: response regulator [Nitrospirota bacterium]